MDMTEYIDEEIRRDIFKTNLYKIINREDIVFIYIEDSSKLDMLREQLLINNFRTNLSKDYIRYEKEYPIYIRAVCNIDILEREARIDIYTYDKAYYKHYREMRHTKNHKVYRIEEILNTWI